MSKRGISHIEMILAFVLFTGAVGFAMYFFGPWNGNGLVETSFKYIYGEIVDETNVKVFTFNVKLNIFEITGNIVAVNISGLDANLVPATFSGGGVKLNSNRSSGADIIYIDSGGDWSGKEFITIRFSEDFESDEVESVVLDDNLYFISSSGVEEKLSEKKLDELAQRYSDDYYGVKENLNLPKRADFRFLVNMTDREITATRDAPEGLEVFSQEKEVEVVRAQGEVEFASLTVSVW